jgi:hypothetical protein
MKIDPYTKWMVIMPAITAAIGYGLIFYFLVIDW